MARRRHHDVAEEHALRSAEHVPGHDGLGLRALPRLDVLDAAKEDLDLHLVGRLPLTVRAADELLDDVPARGTRGDEVLVPALEVLPRAVGRDARDDRALGVEDVRALVVEPVLAEVRQARALGELAAEASGIIVANVTPEDAANLKKELEQARMAMTRGGFTLYVDCMPIGAPAKLASSFFEKANAAIEEVHKVPDYRLVDYGKGAPLFAASVLEQVLESGKDVILDTRTPEGAIVLEALASKASLVVRGLR